MTSQSLILAALVVGSGLQLPTTATADSLFTTISPTGQVTDRFGVGSNLHGLMYADQNETWGPNLFYSIRNDNAGNATFTTISSLTSTATGQMSVGNHAFDAVTFAAPNVGYGPTQFYTLSQDNTGNSTFGTINPTGVPYTPLFGVGQNVDALTFATTDVGYGANLFYALSQNAGLSTFETINPTPGGIVTPQFTVGNNFNDLVFTATDVGYGADLFYYLRTDGTGDSIFGTINADPSFLGTRVVDRFNLGAPYAGLTFTTTDVGYGANLFYTITSSGPVLAVPEPGNLLPLGLLAGLIAVWHRSRARRCPVLDTESRSVDS